MPEYRVRRISFLVMLVAGCLPVLSGFPYFVWMVSYIVVGEVPIEHIFYLPYPCLILLNAYLAFSRTSKPKIKIAYRILLFVSLLWEWIKVLITELGPELQIGFWAVPTVVFVVAMVEVFLMFRERLAKRPSPNR